MVYFFPKSTVIGGSRTGFLEGTFGRFLRQTSQGKDEKVDVLSKKHAKKTKVHNFMALPMAISNFILLVLKLQNFTNTT